MGSNSWQLIDWLFISWLLICFTNLWQGYFMPSCLDLNCTSRLRLPAFVACKSNWWHEYFKPSCFDSIWCLWLFGVVALWSHCLQRYSISSCFDCICFLTFAFKVDWSSHCLHLYCIVWSINSIMTYAWLIFIFHMWKHCPKVLLW